MAQSCSKGIELCKMCMKAQGEAKAGDTIGYIKQIYGPYQRSHRLSYPSKQAVPTELSPILTILGPDVHARGSIQRIKEESNLAIKETTMVSIEMLRLSKRQVPYGSY
jgi:hypothetical protein